MRGENSSEIKEILRKTESDAEPSVIIGGENPLLKEKGLSMVVSDYSIGDDLKGKMAIVGPTRMDYAKVISTLNYMSHHMKGLINPESEDSK